MTGGRYDSWTELSAAWEERDVRCRRRLDPLSEDEIESIRANRRAEISLLPPDDRASAFRALMRWNPPHPAEEWDDRRRSNLVRVA